MGGAKARSEFGHGASQEKAPPTSPDIGPNNSFYTRKRASLSTSALPPAANQARRSTALAANSRTSGEKIALSIRDSAQNRIDIKGKGAETWHNDTDTSEEEDSDSASSDDNAPLATYVAKATASKTSLNGESVAASQSTVKSRPSQHRGKTLVDLDAPSSFHTADKVRNKKITSLNRNPSIRSTRSAEDLTIPSNSNLRPTLQKGAPLAVARPPRLSMTSTRPSSSVGVNAPRPSMPMASPGSTLPGSSRAPRAAIPPAARPYRESPTSSTSNGGDSSSGVVPLTPRDGSEISAKRKEPPRPTHRKSSSVTFAEDVNDKANEQRPVRSAEESKRRERRRSEAKNAIAVG